MLFFWWRKADEVGRSIKMNKLRYSFGFFFGSPVEHHLFQHTFVVVL